MKTFATSNDIQIAYRLNNETVFEGTYLYTNGAWVGMLVDGQEVEVLGAHVFYRA